ncbi:MAG: CARDB domain-containing protein [Vicinamibacterales bacterium]
MSRIWGIVALGFFLAANHAAGVGLLPVPTLAGVEIRADAQDDPVNFWIVYSYTVTNPVGNTGEIWRLKIDVLDPANEIPFASAGLTIPKGTSRVDFFEVMDRLRPIAQITPTPVRPFENIVPFGQNAPAGWNGGLGLDGFASFHSSDQAPTIVPGSSLAGFQLLSYGVPTIKEAQVIPFWVHVVDDHGSVTDEERAQAGAIERSLPRSVQTLAPSGVNPRSTGHWNLLRDDLAKAIKLGWIVDPKLANTLTTQLASARQAFDANDSTQINIRVQQLIDTISTSTPAQRNAEAYALVLLNARRLFDSLPTGFEPAITLAPKGAELNIGEAHVITVTLVNRANNNNPLVGERIVVRVDRGEDIGVEVVDAQTDDKGVASLQYVGRAIGIDKVQAEFCFAGCEGVVRDTGEVVWTGGADLTVPLFSPPLLITQGGQSFFVNEETENVGNVPSPPSVTRYHISPSEPIDPLTAQVVGERNVPALQPGGTNRVSQQVLAIPSGLPPGRYFLAACADANEGVTELSEENNCSFSELRGRLSVQVPMEQPSNRAPDCSKAAPSVATLWPPNHRLVNVSVLGVTDPDGDPVTIAIASITQEEPVNGLGDGDTSPDGFGVGTAQAQLRAERSGTGNGRVYRISFTAADGKGGSCTAGVAVGVPHDMGQGSTPVDDGQTFDSTRP